MSIDRDPRDQTRVEDSGVAKEMASIVEATRGWAKVLAEGMKDPEKIDASMLPPWAAGQQVLERLDLANMVRIGVTPEDIIAYGEECAESVERVAKYGESLNGLTKTQLIQEYFRQFIEGFVNGVKRNRAYDEKKKVIFAVAPEIAAQPKEYREAQKAYEASQEKRALVWDRLMSRQSK